jgi:hypothetical protein
MRYSKNDKTSSAVLQEMGTGITSFIIKYLRVASMLPMGKDYQIIHQVTYHFSIFDKIQITASYIAQAIINKVPLNLIRTRIGRYFYAQNEITGILILVKGRIRGAELARSQRISFGSIPKSTLEHDIQYTTHTCHQIAGTVGLRI